MRRVGSPIDPGRNQIGAAFPLARSEFDPMMRAVDGRSGPIATGLLYYYLTSNIVALGVVLGVDFVEPSAA